MFKGNASAEEQLREFHQMDLKRSPYYLHYPHGDHEDDMGPQITMDYAPIPCMPYKPTYDHLQRKFNLYMIGHTLLFIISCWWVRNFSDSYEKYLTSFS